MREITKAKQANSGIPFYDHVSGLEWVSTDSPSVLNAKTSKKGGKSYVTSTS